MGCIGCFRELLSVTTLALLATSFAFTATAETAATTTFPFVLPWDDASPGATDLSSWLHRPAGSKGHVTARDGHFYVGKERIRFLGVNMSFAAGMPEKADAEKIAARLAKFGVNVVRFHHMDTSAWPNGLRAQGSKSTGELAPEALDRLDYFIAQLKARGIYANLNLLVGRPFNAADGLPAEIEQLDWKERHIPGFFNAKHLALQQEFARALLTHTNAYTGRAYSDEPAVAFVEINNEQGLVHAWLSGDVDRLPQVFREELRMQWNTWLRARYSSVNALRVVWDQGAEPLRAEMLANPTFTNRTTGWVLERHADAAAELTISDELPDALRTASNVNKSAQIRIERPGQAQWHVQLIQSGLGLARGKAYTVSFWAKADGARAISVNVIQAHEPWQRLGLAVDAALDTQWREFRFVFNASDADTNARLGFSSLGAAGANVWLAGISLRPGGVFGLRAGEQLAGDGLPGFQQRTLGERTDPAQRDWMRFLLETENRYWQAMNRFLKDDLRVRAPIAGTIVGCSTPNLMAELDWVDTHAYWQHPNFPVRPWDTENWIVENKSMVNERGGTLPGLALKRVAGKPHACTEYNHPAPNTYSSEGMLLLAAYAALQDWDAIYAYSYAHTRNNGWDLRKFSGFFDVDQHPTKMATFPAAAALFLRGDVQSAKQSVTVPLAPEQEADLLRTARAWSLVDGGSAGIPREAALVHRVAITTQGSKPPRDSVSPERVAIRDERFISDTGELIWDVREKNRGVVTVNSPRSKAVVGYGGGKRFELGDFTIEPADGMQNGWSAITLTALDVDARPPKRWLLTATGYAENTGMTWKNTAKSSVGRNWGQAPSVVEGVAAKLSVANQKNLSAWALDERGQRREKLAAEGDGINIGPQWRTLWYEIELP